MLRFNRIHFWIPLLITFLALPLYGEDNKDVPFTADQHYHIGPGDMLDITVWQDAAMSKTVTVLPDGQISFPLIGQVKAAGKTVGQVQAELKKKIHPFVPNPVVSVVVKQVNSMIIYVIGKVNGPGRFVLNGNIDVLQALSMARGFNPFAEKNDIKIFRKQDGQTLTLPFHYEDVIAGKTPAENIQLMRGDVIVVP